jgi:hypothetical protein
MEELGVGVEQWLYDYHLFPWVMVSLCLGFQKSHPKMYYLKKYF